MGSELVIFVLGIVVAVIGFWVQRFILQPVLRYKDHERHVASRLRYYSHIITNPGSDGEWSLEAERAVRGLSCVFEEYYLGVPLRQVFILTRIMPTDSSASDVSGSLMFISNSLRMSGKSEENWLALERIFRLLKLKELDNRFKIKEYSNIRGDLLEQKAVDR